MLGGLMASAPVFAASIAAPSGKTAWDMTVYGNGYTVHAIMEGIKLIMASPSFNVLLIFLAVLGFVILAIGAGFDPGKNLLKMFSYILVVFFVSMGSRSITINIMLNDKVSEGVVLTYQPLIQDVPALVGMPAVITSKIGDFFTRQFETNFFSTKSFSMSGGAVGQFSLFTRMAEDSTEYRFTAQDLKSTYSSYVSDCTVPAIAQGRLTSKELMNTTSYVGTLAKARHLSIMTKIYADRKETLDAYQSAPMSTAGKDALTAAATPTGLPGNGVVVSCDDAFMGLDAATAVHAKELYSASAAAWKRTGIQVPYATAFDEMLNNSSAKLTTNPASFIRQQAFINATSPALRQAAVQTGNNELMQAVAIAQAEQTQKSSWVTSFQVFNSMMGYVFSVLQVFIFAITPMIVVALMIPGFGTAIFKNYAQILIWLTLWEPMLSVINYIITSFGMSTMNTNLIYDAASQGVQSVSVTTTDTSPLLNRAASYVIAEKMNNLTIAAQFLGTMVPMITWGIVKGAMAFTEFISHGIGSSVAAQAGAVAATGNLSLGNMSMNNVSSNKFNTAMSSTVGTQATNGFLNAGAALGSADAGGGVTMKSGATVDQKAAMNSTLSREEGISRQVADTWSHIKSAKMSQSEAVNYINATTSGETKSRMLSQIESENKQRNQAYGTSDGTSFTLNAAATKALQSQFQTQIEGKFGGGMSFGAFKAGVEASMSTGSSFSQAVSTSMQRAGVKSTSESDQVSRAVAESVSNTLSGGSNYGTSTTSSHSFSKDRSWSESRDHAAQESANYAERLSKMKSVMSSSSFSEDTDMHQALAIVNSFKNEQLSMQQRMDNLDLLSGFVGQNAKAAQTATHTGNLVGQNVTGGGQPPLRARPVADKVGGDKALEAVARATPKPGSVNQQFKQGKARVQGQAAADARGQSNLAGEVRGQNAASFGLNNIFQPSIPKSHKKGN